MTREQQQQHVGESLAVSVYLKLNMAVPTLGMA
jgi:hypothetical protein